MEALTHSTEPVGVHDYDSRHAPSCLVCGRIAELEGLNNESVHAHVVCDSESHEPALLRDEEVQEVEDCLGTGRCILDCWIRPALALDSASNSEEVGSGEAAE